MIIGATEGEGPESEFSRTEGVESKGYALSLSGDSDTERWYAGTQSIDIEPGEILHFSGWLRTRDVSPDGHKYTNCQIAVIALDENGKQLKSVEFAQLLAKQKGKNDIVFIVGGVYGLSQKILNKTNLVLSFSKFTFTHQMIRMILSEQLYRAFTIMEGKKYHY